MKNNEQIIMLVDDRLFKSLLSDACTVISFVAMIGIGVLLESSAMQWVGALMWMMAVIGKAALISSKQRYTISEARSELDKLEDANK